MMRITRRRFLGGCLSAGVVGLAGCLDDTDEETEDLRQDPEDVPPQRRIGNRVLSSSFPMEIYDPETDDRLAQVHWHGDEDRSHWHQAPLDVPLDRWATYEVRVWDQNSDRISLGETEPFRLVVVRTEDTAGGLIETNITGNLVDIRGQSPGNGEFVFRIVSDDEILWNSPVLLVSVS